MIPLTTAVVPAKTAHTIKALTYIADYNNNLSHPVYVLCRHGVQNNNVITHI